MIADLNTDYITINTNCDGYFKVTITATNGTIVFCENITSHKNQIILKGFSLKKHSIKLSPIK